jgi:hypothetical protein
MENLHKLIDYSWTLSPVASQKHPLGNINTERVEKIFFDIILRKKKKLQNPQ